MNKNTYAFAKQNQIQLRAVKRVILALEEEKKNSDRGFPHSQVPMQSLAMQSHALAARLATCKFV